MLDGWFRHMFSLLSGIAGRGQGKRLGQVQSVGFFPPLAKQRHGVGLYGGE